MDPILQFLGRLHPMILHAPIGVAIALATLELLGVTRARIAGRRMKDAGGGRSAAASTSSFSREARAPLAWLLVLSSAASIGSGLLLHEEGGYKAPTVDLHQWLAISVGGLAFFAAVFQQLRLMRAYFGALILMCAVLMPAGHFGASLTHGDNFLFKPFDPPQPPAPIRGAQGEPGSPSSQTVFASTIQPIFNRTCVSCHGDDRSKGGLKLNTAEGLLAGSEYGPVIRAGDVAGSELIRRLHLPVDDEDRMPPKSKPQLTPEEIKAIEDWVAAGASVTAIDPNAPAVASPGTRATDPSNTTAGANPAGGAGSAPAASSSNVKPVELARADPAHLAALTEALVHVEPLSRDSNMLLVSVAAMAPRIDDAEAERLLRPVAAFIADLDLSRSHITDQSLTLVGAMPNLKRVNLSSTGVTDAGLASLSNLASLEDLIVTNTKITVAAAPALNSLRSLKHVYAWKSGITPDDAAKLREQYPTIAFNLGDAATTEALEAETEVKLSNDAAAVPGAAAPGAAPTAPAAASLKPVNALCPVSDKPVDPEFAIVRDGKVIGFCCKHCLAQFLDDPAKFAEKIK